MLPLPFYGHTNAKYEMKMRRMKGESNCQYERVNQWWDKAIKECLPTDLFTLSSFNQPILNLQTHNEILVCYQCLRLCLVNGHGHLSRM
jgi:hypothetical protein